MLTFKGQHGRQPASWPRCVPWVTAVEFINLSPQPWSCQMAFLRKCFIPSHPLAGQPETASHTAQGADNWSLSETLGKQIEAACLERSCMLQPVRKYWYLVLHQERESWKNWGCLLTTQMPCS